MIISIKHRFTDDILYEHDCEDNSLKKTLEFAVKYGAILSGASLSGASLSGAILEGAILSGAYLSGAYLSGANLSGAYLRGANLSGANLSGAILEGAILSGAYLSGANLSGAYLSGAYLSGANLSGANLEVKTPPNDHYFISEILFRNAKTQPQKDMASRIRMELGKCWKYFHKLAKKKKVIKWAKSVLSQWDEFKEISIKLEKGE